MPWMVDQRHYLDVLDPLLVEQIPAPARRIAGFFGSIVEGVTAGWDDPVVGCALTTRCIGRVGRCRCTDRLVARVIKGHSTDDNGNLISAEIVEWVCLGCGESGEIHHWQETPWNLTGSGSHLFPAVDVVVELEMTLAEYEAVAAIAVLDAPARRVVAAGRTPDEGFVLFEAPRAWVKHLVEFIASESNHSRSKKKVALFDAVLDRAGGVG